MHIQTANSASTTTTTATMPYPALPASPTLTNPDMILPYEFDDSTPSPPQTPYQPLEGTWKDTKTTNLQFSIGPPHMAAPITPTTPIIYGNGTMLSDIGEVTEVESTPRRLPAPAERRALKQMGGPLRASPSMGHQALLKRTKMGTHERKTSIESTSTVTSEGHAAEHLFADFDDGVSVDDSVFQGDDEESVADSSVVDLYTEEVVASETQRLSAKENENDEEDDRNSSAALSRRAEQILLNAKKRLTNMEGNLSRARSSLYTAPAGPLSSIHSSSPLSRSTPSPLENGQRIVSQLGVVPSMHREISHAQGGSPGHARVYSENSIPSVQSQKAPFILRSASAGAGYVAKNRSMSLRRSPHTSQESLHRTESRGSRLIPISPSSISSPPPHLSSPLGHTLEPLGEDEAVQDMDKQPDTARSSIQAEYMSLGEHPRGLTRSASSMQMRDLKDQMHDLKGRLSSLRDRAREDTMKRRSLQSLRTPSPFTAAEQWYTEHNDYKEGGLSADKLVAQTPWKEDVSAANPTANEKDIHQVTTSEYTPVYAATDASSVYEDVHETQHTVLEIDEPESIPEKDDEDEEEEEEGAHHYEIANDIESEYSDEIVNHDELDDYDSESDISIYHDTIMPISHEDREDAFDYEHFFLHSAMGTISQQKYRRRGSTSSCSSEDSVATARGPTTNPDEAMPSLSEEKPSLAHLRNASSDSISTLATFATAEEGDYDRDEDDDRDDYAVQSVETQVHTTPVKVKRSTFGPPLDEVASQDSTSSPESQKAKSPSAIQKGRFISGHRPSVSSFDSMSSTGTTRSFPLVNKPKPSTPDLKSSGSILSASDSLTLNENQNADSSPVHMLAKEDQILVERLVASLGKCVLGLQEAGRASYEGRVWRRRLDAARRVLEGEEGAV